MARAAKRGDKYILELTEDEARAVNFVSNVVGGDPKKSLRGEIDDIRKALRSSGLPYEEGYMKAYTGDVYFNNSSKTKGIKGEDGNDLLS